MDYSKTTIEELAARVATHLQAQGIEVVLVGGLAVEIYTDNLYLTKDIDMVNTNYSRPQVLHQAMAQLAFYKQGRVFISDTTEITVEFPSGPLAVGDELIQASTVVQIGDLRLPILRQEDVVKDRLSAFMHWSDHQSLVQAVAIMRNHSCSLEPFEAFCQREGSAAQSQLLWQLYSNANEKQLNSMQQLATELSQLLLDTL